jgi:hypothetical protein
MIVTPHQIGRQSSPSGLRVMQLFRRFLSWKQASLLTMRAVGSSCNATLCMHTPHLQVGVRGVAFRVVQPNAT